MNRILSLKQTMTLDQAAGHLSNIANDPVTETDLLELALHGQLTLSLTISGNYFATPYNASASKEAREVLDRLNCQKGTAEYTKLLLAMVEYASFCIRWDDDETDMWGPSFMDSQTVSGVWDLSMLGMERELITDLMSSRLSDVATFTGGGRMENNKPLLLRHITDTDFLVGLFITEENRQMESIEEDSVLESIEEQGVEENLVLIGFSQRKLQRFPTGSFLVIRTANLQKFVSQITDDSGIHRQGPTANNSQNNEHQEYPLHLEALTLAWRKYWKNADPTDRSTCPKKDSVKKWLIEQGFSAKNADAGATIIKPQWATDKGW